MKKQLINKFSSKYNGIIEVIKGLSGYNLLVSDVTQSGDDIEIIWDEALEKLISKETQLNSVLILGFGAGSIVAPLRRLWPEVKITGVEIDPVMIKIANRYFPENLAEVEVIRGDALSFIERCLKNNLSFDLIVVDCYIGDTEPESIKKIDTLKDLKKITKNVLLNQLFLPDSPSEMSKIGFLKELDKIYPVRALKLSYNIIITF